MPTQVRPIRDDELTAYLDVAAAADEVRRIGA
jgi:hypothetical protein